MFMSFILGRARHIEFLFYTPWVEIGTTAWLNITSEVKVVKAPFDVYRASIPFVRAACLSHLSQIVTMAPAQLFATGIFNLQSQCLYQCLWWHCCWSYRYLEQKIKYLCHMTGRLQPEDFGSFDTKDGYAGLDASANVLRQLLVKAGKACSGLAQNAILHTYRGVKYRLLTCVL